MPADAEFPRGWNLPGSSVATGSVAAADIPPSGLPTVGPVSHVITDIRAVVWAGPGAVPTIFPIAVYDVTAAVFLNSQLGVIVIEQASTVETFEWTGQIVGPSMHCIQAQIAIVLPANYGATINMSGYDI